MRNRSIFVGSALLLALGSAIVLADVRPNGSVNVELQTSAGNIVLELDGNRAPRSVANFLKYVKSGHYNGTVFHRVIDGFMIQGGGLDRDLREKETLPPVENEAGNGLKNDKYSVAMARSGDPNSATSQWFINMDDNSDDLDGQNGGFTVFGRVIGDGMAVVDKINSLVRLNFDGGALSELPVLVSGVLTAIGSGNVVFTTFTEVVGFEINAGLSGAWFNAATAGQGWLFDVIDDGERKEVFVTWFTFHVEPPDGDDADTFGSTQHRWLTASGSFDGDTAMLTIFRNTGGVFNDPTPTMLEAIGTMTIRFFDCFSGEIEFDFDDDAFPDATVSIIRLSPDAFCADLAVPAG